MTDIIKNAMILFAITICAGLLLGTTYSVTKEPIEKQQAIILNNALNTVIKDAEFTENTNLSLEEYRSITNVYEATKDGEVVGYAFKIATKEGYGGVIEMIAGITIDGKVAGIDITKHNETPGLGANADQAGFKDQFIDKPLSFLTVVKDGVKEENEIESLSGATITSKAITNAVNQAIEFYENNALGQEGN